MVHGLNTNPHETNVQQEEIRYKLLKLIEQDPTLDQRGLAKAVGVSLGRTNYCMKALVEKGHIKAGNFKRSRNKAGYLYSLTPEGLEEKYSLARTFLSIKQREYAMLRDEIETLTAIVEKPLSAKAGISK